MLEPTVLEYVRAAFQLDRRRFCQQFDAPVLISALADLGDAFQSVKTRLLLVEPAQTQGRKPPLQKISPVITLRSQGGASDEVHVGRGEENDVVLNHDTISVRHALFRLPAGDGPTALEDLGSTNGTRRNGEPLSAGAPQTLVDGDVLVLGECPFVYYTAGGLYDLLRPKR